MDKLHKRRINRVANVTALAVLALMLFEIVMISGAIELKAQAVAKYAPWAYEPFLRLVGEHPESAPRAAMIAEEEPEEKSDPLATATLDQTGLLLEVPVAIETNVVQESSDPVEPEPEVQPEAQPEVAPTNAPAEKAEEVMPVG